MSSLGALSADTIEYKRLKSALDAVTNLHTFVQTGKKNRGKSGLRARCTECGFAYPCPTIEVIDKELKLKS